jgi:N6-L-threonylcarbamoyladenine synthase
VKKAALAFDTSNYTTSCAAFDGWTGRNAGRLLDVEPGRLGLRQSDALFLHCEKPAVRFRGARHVEGILAVGASAKPRETEDSYMPCFLAGRSQGAVLARVWTCPFLSFRTSRGILPRRPGRPGALTF